MSLMLPKLRNSNYVSKKRMFHFLASIGCRARCHLAQDELSVRPTSPLLFCSSMNYNTALSLRNWYVPLRKMFDLTLINSDKFLTVCSLSSVSHNYNRCRQVDHNHIVKK